MGTWDPGNFDSDDAVDYSSEVIRGLVDTVEQLFAQGRASLDDQGEGKLMPTVEMIGVLCDWCRGETPSIRMQHRARRSVPGGWVASAFRLGLLAAGGGAVGGTTTPWAPHPRRSWSEPDRWSFDQQQVVRVLVSQVYHSVVFRPVPAEEQVEWRLVGHAGQLAVADLEAVEHGRVEQPASLMAGPPIRLPAAGGEPEGCANSDVAGELRLRTEPRPRCMTPLEPPEAVLRVVETRLPRAVPLDRPVRPPCPRRSWQGPGDPGPAPPAHGPTSPAAATTARTRRSGAPCRDQPLIAPNPLVLLRGHARHAVALASAAGRRQVDLSTPATRTAPTRRERAAVDRSPGGRIPAGATSASRASCSVSTCACLQPRSAAHCAATGSTRRHGVRVVPAGRFCASRPPGSSPAMSSPWTRYGCDGCTC